MQRECNDVAFGELILSTRLKRNKKKIHPSLKSWYRRSVQLLNMSCRWAPPQEGIAFTNQYLSKYLESSQTSTSTPQTRALLWRIEHDKVVGCVKPAKGRKHHCKTASGETWRWWRQIDGHWSWRGAKRLRKGPRGQMLHQQRWRD